MNKIKGLIYKVTSPSGRIYIGQTVKTLKRRKQMHESNARNKNSNNYNAKICKAIRKYGDNLNWEIIRENVNIEDLGDLEEFYISEHDSFKNGYNGTPYRCAGFTGKKHSNKTKEIISKLRKGENNPMFGMKGKLNPFYGQKHTEESIAKMKENQPDKSGENNPMYGKKGEQHPAFGRKVSEEQKQNLSEKRKGKNNPFHGRKHTEDAKRKMSLARMGNQYAKKKI